MILQKSFQYADLLFTKNAFLLSVLKTVALLNLYVETMIHVYLKYKYFISIIINVFTVTFDQFNVYLLNKSINFFLKNPNFWMVVYLLVFKCLSDKLWSG